MKVLTILALTLQPLTPHFTPNFAVGQADRTLPEPWLITTKAAKGNSIWHEFERIVNQLEKEELGE